MKSATELTRGAVLEHLIGFCWDVYNSTTDERLRGRAGAIIDAYVPDYVSFDEGERIKERAVGTRGLESRLLDDVG